MSKIQLSAFVNFQGRAREAMEFYHKVLGGRLDLQASNGQGVSNPAGPGDRISEGRLETDGALIIGSDGHPSYPPTPGDNIAIALNGSDKARLTRVFNDLAEGGGILAPLQRQSSGSEVGWLSDKFGIRWTVRIDA